MSPNATQVKFGYPDTLVRDYQHWSVLLRPVQVTLGSLVLACRSDVKQFSGIGNDAFSELGVVIVHVEKALGAFVSYDRINYLMLMMVDPHVHFHVFPRHAEPREFGGLEFTDSGWPGPPDLKGGLSIDRTTRIDLMAALVKLWPKDRS